MDGVAGEARHERGGDAPADHKEANPVGQPHPLRHQLRRYLRAMRAISGSQYPAMACPGAVR